MSKQTKRLYCAYNKKKTFKAYIVAENYNDACKAFEDWLNKHDYGFQSDREVTYMELLASTATCLLNDRSKGLLLLDNEGELE